MPRARVSAIPLTGTLVWTPIRTLPTGRREPPIALSTLTPHCPGSRWPANLVPDFVFQVAADLQLAPKATPAKVFLLARGASAGAVFGAIVGNSSSAAHGAVMGGLIGGVRASEQRDIDYDRAYRRCMYGLERMR